MNEVKALKMALRALNATMTTHGTKEAIDEARQEAAKACEEILDQPTFWMNCKTLADSIHYPKCWDIAAYPTLDDALDEMVAWFEISECSTCEEELAQPEREWIGLTYEDMIEVWNKLYKERTDVMPLPTTFAKAVEAKLKQKNGYAEEKNT